MKKGYFSALFICISAWSFGQIVNIPDIKFKFKLVNTDCAKLIDATNFSDVDANNDGEIQLSEAQNIEELNASTVDNYAADDILSLEGIAAFSNLKILTFLGNNIPTVDLSMLTALEELSCYRNQINTLNITGLENLRFVLCNANSLSSMDLTGLTGLTGLTCGSNPLTSLDITGAPNLVSLDCLGSNITTFTSGYLPSLRFLALAFNSLTALDTQQFPNLEYLACGNTSITSIDLSGLSHLVELYISNTLITTLDCSQTAVDILYCGDNPNLTSVNIRNNIVSINEFCENCIIRFDFTNTPNLATACVDEGEQYNELFFQPIQLFGGPNCDVLLGVTTNDIEDTLVLYPNPVADLITIEKNSTTEIESIAIHNTLGQLVKTLAGSELSSSSSIDVSALKTGTYFMEITSNNGKTTKKFVKL